MNEVLLKVENLTKWFPLTKGLFDVALSRGKIRNVRAVDDVSFEVRRHEVFGLVGETGSGKSTIAKLILRLMEPTGGKIFFDNRDIFDMNKEEEKAFRREVQMIFQDPFASLNPRKKIFEIVSTPMKVHKWGTPTERKEKVAELLNTVGLTPPQDMMERYPHELSGGQRQRVGIARALVFTPKLIVADEPVSALDVSIQAQVLNLLNDVKRELGTTYLLVAHDLAVIRHMSDTIAILYLGELCELSSKEDLFKSPHHPYTKALLACVPVPDPDFRREKMAIEGELPSPIDVPTGCRFNTRCPFAKKACYKEQPNMTEVSKGHFVACYLYS